MTRQDTISCRKRSGLRAPAGLVAAAAMLALGFAPAARADPPTLYNQNTNIHFGVISQNFEGTPAETYDPFDNQAADDFTVWSGYTWSVTHVWARGRYVAATTPVPVPQTPINSGGEVPVPSSTRGPADSVNVFFYADANGIPGPEVAATRGITNELTDGGWLEQLYIELPEPVNLTPGRYWVSVQTNQRYQLHGEWRWHASSERWGLDATWRNPGDGYGTSCTSWRQMTSCFGPDYDVRSISFALYGTSTKTSGGGGGKKVR